MKDHFKFEEVNIPEIPFHIEVDLYEIGEKNQLLVVPCNDSYVIVHNNQHLCTLAHTYNESEGWEQEEEALDEEVVARIGAAIKSFTPS